MTKAIQTIYCLMLNFEVFIHREDSSFLILRRKFGDIWDFTITENGIKYK